MDLNGKIKCVHNPYQIFCLMKAHKKDQAIKS